MNYLGRMGWSMPDHREKFSLDDMQAAFDIDRVSLGGPIFDVEKLKWLNGLWLRENFDAEQLKERLKAWLWNDATLDKILPHAQGRMEVLSDFVPMSSYLLSGRSQSTLLHLTVPRKQLKRLSDVTVCFVASRGSAGLGA